MEATQRTNLPGERRNERRESECVQNECSSGHPGHPPDALARTSQRAAVARLHPTNGRHRPPITACPVHLKGSGFQGGEANPFCLLEPERLERVDYCRAFHAAMISASRAMSERGPDSIRSLRSWVTAAEYHHS